MSMLADIAAFLAAGGLGTVGTDIFYAREPDEPDDVVCLHEYAGLPPLERETIDRPGLQVTTRSMSYETGRTKLQSVQNLLMRVGYSEDATYFDGVTVNGTEYLKIEAAQGAQPAYPDAQNRLLHKQNFYVLKRR